METFVSTALEVYPAVIEAVKAKIVELGKADAGIAPEEVMAVMSRLIVEEVERRGDELQRRTGLDAVGFLGFAHAHKAELEVYLVAHPEQRAALEFYLSPFSLPPQPSN